MRTSLPWIIFGYFRHREELMAPLTFSFRALSFCLAFSNVLSIIGFAVDGMLER